VRPIQLLVRLLHSHIDPNWLMLIKTDLKFSIRDNRAYRKSTDALEYKGPKRSFTGSSRFCLQPRYRSVVRTET